MGSDTDDDVAYRPFHSDFLKQCQNDENDLLELFVNMSQNKNYYENLTQISEKSSAEDNEIDDAIRMAYENTISFTKLLKMNHISFSISDLIINDSKIEAYSHSNIMGLDNTHENINTNTANQLITRITSNDSGITNC
nr:2225_t:CDS:2 [Entrophospora candida]